MSQQSSSPQHDASASPSHGNAGLAMLVVGAVGVVFGDIGTSPLYTIKEMFNPHFGLVPDALTVKGLLSLGFWSLILVVTLKYVLVIMRADNDGEGGIMALTALAQRSLAKGSRMSYVVGILGIFGASLFFGDGMITPPITVLGAVEGLSVISPRLGEWVVPISLVILVGLFAGQRFGTAKVGRIFGPVMVTWFVVLAALGILNIVDNPIVLRALSPAWAFRFFADHGWHALLVLGAVVLTVTGGEALYADMGHSASGRSAGAGSVSCCRTLVLNTSPRRGALDNPRAVANRSNMSAPDWAQVPLWCLPPTCCDRVPGGDHRCVLVTRQAIQLGTCRACRSATPAATPSARYTLPSITGCVRCSGSLVLTSAVRPTWRPRTACRSPEPC